MKTLRSFFYVWPVVLLLLAVDLANAQTAIEYLNQVPKFKDSVCTCSKEAREQYTQAIDNLKTKVAEDAENRKNEMDNYMEGNRGTMENAMMKQAAEKSGLSMEEIQSLKDKEDMTEEEKEALINKTLQKQNLSLDEVKKMQNMSKEGQQAWAQAYAAEQMANAQANPEQYKKLQQQNDKAFATQRIYQEQQANQAKIKNFENEISNRMLMLQSEAGKEKAPIDDKLKKLDAELQSIGSIYDCNECPPPPKADVERWNSVIREIHELNKPYNEYCKKYTARLKNYYSWLQESLISNMALYNKAEELVVQTTAATTDTQLSLPDKAKGYYSLQVVANYLNSLDLFKFRPDFDQDAYDFYK